MPFIKNFIINLMTFNFENNKAQGFYIWYKAFYHMVLYKRSSYYAAGVENDPTQGVT